MGTLSFLEDLVKNPPHKPVLVYFDPDVDGLIAGKFYCDWLDRHLIPYETYINPNRQHGFLLSPQSVEGRVVLSGDFRVEETKFRELVLSHNVRYLTSDHHENEVNIPHLTDPAGRTLGVYYNTSWLGKNYLSGAGAVLEMLSEHDPSMMNRTNRALVGITLLSDVCPISHSEEAHSYLEELYSHPYEGYIRYLIDTINKFNRDYGFGVPVFNRVFCDRKFSPFVNAMLRHNQGNAAIDFIVKGKPPMKDYSSLQKTLLSTQDEWTKVFSTDYVNVIVVDRDSVPISHRSVIGNFLGLLASRGSDSRSTLALTTESQRVTRASFRGKYDLPYRSTLQSETGIECVGHNSAFGVKLDKLTPDFLQTLSETVRVLEEGYKDKGLDSVVTDNLLDWSKSNIGRKISYTNQFLLSQDKTYVKYTGPYTTERITPRYQWYSANGVRVTGFNREHSISNTVIEPVYDRGTISFMLR